MNSNTTTRRRRAPVDYGPLFVGTNRRGKRERPTNEPTNNERDASETEEYRPLYWWQRD